MIELEKKYYEKGMDLVCGIDEVGRGSLFGDVVVCSIIMPKTRITGVRDSKKLSQSKREKLYDEILKNCLAYGIGIMDSVTIDKINIKMATHLAMLLSIQNLRTKDGQKVKPDVLLVDAEHLETDIHQESIVKGDDLVYSISCASIVAKVYRDRLCEKWDKEYPSYEIAKHKGYGTKRHREILSEIGPSPLHRKTFLKNMENWK